MVPKIHHVLEVKLQINITEKEREMESDARDRGTLGVGCVGFSLSRAARKKAGRRNDK